MHPRLRRLQADHDMVQRTFAEHPFVRLEKAEGAPPDKYTFTIHVAGLVPAGDEGFSPGEIHRAEIFLPIDYPRRPPICRMLSPIFHPNIDPQKICIGDHWSAGQSLAQLTIHIAEMICYQSYNLKSPLNAAAAAWAAQNLDSLPLQRADLSVGLGQ